LPFELSFADVVVVFKPPAKPRVPAVRPVSRLPCCLLVVSAFSLTEGPYMLALTQWWVAMWAEKREAKEKENPK
jgi:hypothetical protein